MQKVPSWRYPLPSRELAAGCVQSRFLSLCAYQNKWPRDLKIPAALRKHKRHGDLLPPWR